MRQCILHVGLHKTGSTSIQASLAAGVAAATYRYHGFGQVNGSEGLTALFSDTPDSYHLFQRRGWSKRKVEAYRRQRATEFDTVLRTAGMDVVLSGEDASRLSRSALTRLREYLAARGCRVAVVAYLRPWHGYIESAFQEDCKARLPSLLLPQGRDDTQRQVLRPLSLDYRAVIESFDSVFGRNAVRILGYFPKSFLSGCVVEDFCQQLGVLADPRMIVRSNQSLSRPAVQLLYAYRRFCPASAGGTFAFLSDQLLVNELYAIDGPPLRLHSSVTAPRIVEVEGQRAWIAERIGCSFDDDAAPNALDAIRTESDLFDFDPRALEWLLGATGGGPLQQRRGDLAAREVARRMHRLRVWLGRQHVVSASVQRMRQLVSRVLGVLQ
jgi:hypothetical protein